MELECLPYGVGHNSEGLCLWVRIGPHRILLDCGLEDLSGLIAEGSHLHVADCIICSHAHDDHARGLPALHRLAPQLPVYASEVTARLLSLNWPDDADTPNFCQGLPWRTPVEIEDDLWVELFPAGHLPGASVTRLTYHGSDRTYSVVYTGDFLLSNTRLVDGLPLEELRGWNPDVLIVEGSYGTARYPRRRSQENQLAERIARALSSGYAILMLVPTLGLGQELLMLLRSHHHFTGREIDIWVGGTVADGCDAYLNILPHLPTAAQNFARHQPLFWDDRIRPHTRRLTAEDRLSHPCIVLTDLDADLHQYCRESEQKWLVLRPLKPGYPVPDSDIEELSHVHVETYLLSEHCDRSGTTQLIHNLRPQHVVFVHGSPNYLADLINLEELRNRYQLHYPAAGKLVELPLREKHSQPDFADAIYEGELTEHQNCVTVTLPISIARDSRWQILADTGIVETHWQGDELVLRGVPQRELLGRDRFVPPDTACCANCRYYRGQQCLNADSPLHGLKVTPDGICPVFEAEDDEGVTR
ncbi:MAG: MBL fold metallo-hydrolase [Cyanobacteria bacterium SID2]|nr:MBL fold metallo-hydrolase [Cyanobacteria bacterium SID2]MBP0005922.1 MBL fold metallo-hydrolase [Cyanobacteria bacterium SBC]